MPVGDCSRKSAVHRIPADLVGRLGGQLRAIPGAVLCWDMGAALALAQALGIDTLIAAELLPEIEAVMVRKLNEQMEGGRDG
ncbi:MAG: hypothetical protein V4747_06930 [Pseudomonadota bacterium]